MHAPYPTQRLDGGRFQLLALLRVGGVAAAWRALETATGRDVALKVLPAANGGAERAVREAELSRKVAGGSDEGVAMVHEVFLEADHAWMVMDLARCSLADHVATFGPLAAPQAAGALLGPLHALARAHALGVVHRDVKPHNLLLYADGSVRLADWGAARARLDGNGTTRTGALLGTVPFLAPEQRRDPRQAAAPADIYAMAVTLAWLCLGEAPEDPALPEAHAGLAARLPRDLADLVRQAGAYAPAARPSAEELADALREGWIGDGADTSLRIPGPDDIPDDTLTAVARVQPTPSVQPATRGPRTALGVAALGVAAMGIYGWSSATRSDPVDMLPATTADSGPAEVLATLGRYPRCGTHVGQWIDTLHAAPRETVGVAVYDLDADGSPDVVYTNQQDENATVWWGEKGRLPLRADTLPIGRSSRAVSPGDVDGDGRADLVVYRPDEGMFDLWRGTGDRRFEKADTSSHTEILSAAVLDWDGDRDLDLVMDIRALWMVGLRERAAGGWAPHRWVATGRVGGIVRRSGTPHVLIRKEDGAMTLAAPAEPRPREETLFAQGDARGRAHLIGALDADGDGSDALYFSLGPLVLRHDLASGATCRFTDLGAMTGGVAAVADLDGDGDVELIEGRTCGGCTSNHVFRIAE